MAILPMYDPLPQIQSPALHVHRSLERFQSVAPAIHHDWRIYLEVFPLVCLFLAAIPRQSSGGKQKSAILTKTAANNATAESISLGAGGGSGIN